MKTIAVLALQGAFVEHEHLLQEFGYKILELRNALDLQKSFDGLVLPGGESTVQSKLLRSLGMFAPIHEAIDDGIAVLGTCAGLILMADAIEGTGDLDKRSKELAKMRLKVEGFQTLPVSVKRNGYGRQLGSSHATGLTLDGRKIPLTFIRAPKITSTEIGVETLAEFEGSPVAVRFKNQVACTFHPELDTDSWLYRYWLRLV